MVRLGRGDFIQDEQDFYRCLASDAASRALRKIQEILSDDTLDDPAYFHRIEAIVSLLEDLGVDCGGRHDF